MKPKSHSWVSFLHELQTYELRWRVLDFSGKTNLIAFVLTNVLNMEELIYLRVDLAKSDVTSELSGAIKNMWEAPKRTSTQKIRFLVDQNESQILVINVNEGICEFQLAGTLSNRTLCKLTLETFTHLFLDAFVVFITAKTFGVQNADMFSKKHVQTWHAAWYTMRHHAKMRQVPLPLVEGNLNQ
eukprot:PhF_6_TR19606/c0_g1_i1/m.28606